MKKLILLSAAMILSTSAFAKMTFEQYVTADFDSITKKVKQDDKCYSARYEKMMVTVKKAKEDKATQESLKSKVKDFCAGKIKADAVFERDGKKYNGIALYKGDVDTAVCKDKKNDNKGTVWFVDSSECKDIEL